MGILDNSMMRKYTYITLMGAFLFVLIPRSSYGDSSMRPHREAALKSALLYQISTFITWKNQAGTANRKYYCVLDDPYFEEVLDQTVQDKRLHDREIIVEAFDENDPGQKCHILYVAHDSPANQRTDGFFVELSREGVLIIGSTAQLMEIGGHIYLNSRNNRIEMEFSREILSHASLQMSSRLASYGRIRE